MNIQSMIKVLLEKFGGEDAYQKNPKQFIRNLEIELGIRIPLMPYQRLIRFLMSRKSQHLTLR